jgi:hypothetical protein
MRPLHHPRRSTEGFGDMGRFQGVGGWIGPGSRHATWANQRWWRLYVSLGVLAALLMFPVQYFGLVSNRNDHQVRPSIIGAIVFGAAFGLGMFAFAAWTRRKTGRGG